MRPRAVVRSVHLWAGLVLTLLLLVLGATGSALVYRDAYWRWVYPDLRGPVPALSAADHAAAIVAAETRFDDALRSVKLPEPGVNAYHLYLAEGEAFMAIRSHRVIDRWRPGERPMAFLFDLHAHLMAGEAGERVGGAVALFGVLMAVTGVYLWWPARRKFGVRTLLPTGWARRKILPSHRDLGLLATPILLVLLLTGAGIVFYGAAGTLLNGVMPGPSPMPEGPPTVATHATSKVTRTVAARDGAGGVPPAPDAAVARIEAATTAFPEARIVFYYPPDDAGIHGFRLKQPCERHPNGRSYVYLTADARALKTVDACQQPAGQRALYTVYPLHAGKLDSGTYQFLVFAGGLALTLISATGALAYTAKLTGAR